MATFRSHLKSATSMALATSLILSSQVANAQELSDIGSYEPGYFDPGYADRPVLSFTAQDGVRGQQQATPAQSRGVPWLLVGGLAVGAAVAIGLAGGGGGGDGGQSPDPVDPDPVDPNPQPQPPGNPQDFETAEYRRDYTLGMINASTRYAAGGTGKGVLLGVYDTGADIGHADLPNVVYAHSYFTGNSDVTDYNSHGTHVAATVAGAKNDFGGHGVAFDSELAIFQGVRWEGSPSKIMGSRAALADATRRASSMGAAAMNHSWVFINEDESTRLITEFSGRQDLRSFLGSDLIDAFNDATRSGMISVFATGNDGAEDVSVLAGIPVYMPEYADSILAVGAVDSYGRIASFSNRCGIAKDVCLVAPGVGVYAAVSSDSGRAENSFGYMSGTSMATPHVTGAIGVVKSNFPELTGAEISRILRDTATDLGAPGVDDVFGNGLLNLENAVAPQGTIVVKTGRDIHDGEMPLDRSWVGGGAASVGLAKALSGTDMMVADRYDRGYAVDMGALVSTGSSAFDGKTAGLARFTGVHASQANETGISISFGGIDAEDAATWADASALGSAFADLASAPVLGFSEETALGKVSLRSAFGDDGSYAAAEFEAPIGNGHSLSIEAGQLAEAGGFLGTSVTGAFGDDLSSSTRFARLAGTAKIGTNTTFHASASLGKTDFRSSGILSEGSGIASQAIGFGVETRGVFASNDSLTIGISQPLTMSGGRLTLDTPVAMAASDGEERATGIYRDRTDIDLGSSRAPTDIQLGYSTGFMGGRASLGGVWRTGDDEGLGLAAGLSMNF